MGLCFNISTVEDTTIGMLVPSASLAEPVSTSIACFV